MNTGAKHIFKKKEQNFTQVTNTIIEDNRISWKAKGIYLAIQRFITISDWEFKKSHLISLSKEGEKAFNSGWKELKVAGYLKQYRMPNPERNGTFDYYYELLDEPNIETPYITNLTIDGKVSQGEFKAQQMEKASKPSEEAIPTIYPKKVCMLKGGGAKGGVYNNTYNNNTNNTNTNNKKISKDKIYNNNIYSDTEENNNLNFSDLSISNSNNLEVEEDKTDLLSTKPDVKIPDGMDIDKHIVNLLKKDRAFRGIDFDSNEFNYMAFVEAVVKTQIQDNVEILSLPQWNYFRQTLLNKLSLKNNNIKSTYIDLENKLLGWD